MKTIIRIYTWETWGTTLPKITEIDLKTTM